MKEIVMYSRIYGCPFVRTAKHVFNRNKLDYREVYINKNEPAKKRVVEWTGFESVPTIIVANQGTDLPIEPPALLAPGASPKGVDRGSMITEPSKQQLIDWLQKHGFID